MTSSSLSLPNSHLSSGLHNPGPVYSLRLIVASLCVPPAPGSVWTSKDPSVIRGGTETRSRLSSGLEHGDHAAVRF